MAATGRIAAAAQIDSSYSPGGANVHFHLVDRCLVHTSRPQKAEDMLVPPLLRNCLTLNYISLSYSHYLPSRTLVLAIVVHCLGHFKIYMMMMMMISIGSTAFARLTSVPDEQTRRPRNVRHV